MVQKLLLFVVFSGMSSGVVASGKDTPLTLAQQAEASLYARSAQLITEQKQTAARHSECSQESIFNKKGMHRRSAAIFPQSWKSLLAQTGIVMPEQAAVVAASVQAFVPSSSSTQ